MREDVQSLLAANREFYRAFAEADIDAMTELWSRAYPVACIHPGWGPLLDRDQVIMSWRQILAGGHNGGVRCTNETPYLFDHVAFIVCHEVLDAGVLVATNIFRQEDGDWRMVHHQASPLAVMPEDHADELTSERLH